jgi:hypothetical protein
MRWLLSFTVAFLWSVVVQAKSFTGNRLLVVLEEQAEREKYSVFLEDLTCKLVFLQSELAQSHVFCVFEQPFR